MSFTKNSESEMNAENRRFFIHFNVYIIILIIEECLKNKTFSDYFYAEKSITFSESCEMYDKFRQIYMIYREIEGWKWNSF